MHVREPIVESEHDRSSRHPRSLQTLERTASAENGTAAPQKVLKMLLEQVHRGGHLRGVMRGAPRDRVIDEDPNAVCARTAESGNDASERVLRPKTPGHGSERSGAVTDR